MSNSTLLYKNLTFIFSNPMFRVGEERRGPEMRLCPQALFPMAYGLRRTTGTEVARTSKTQYFLSGDSFLVVISIKTFLHMRHTFCYIF